MKNRFNGKKSIALCSIGLLSCLMVGTTSSADIGFHFMHKRAEGDHGNVYAVYSSAKAEKTNGAHSTDTCISGNCELLAGRDKWDKAKRSIFANDPSGNYVVTVSCFAYKWNSKAFKQQTDFKKIISLPNDDTNVSIEISCPMTEDRGDFTLRPPEMTETIFSK